MENISVNINGIVLDVVNGNLLYIENDYKHIIIEGGDVWTNYPSLREKLQSLEKELRTILP